MPRNSVIAVPSAITFRKNKLTALGLIAAWFLYAGFSFAAPGFVVTINDDSTDGADGFTSLREAIIAANAAGGTQFINFDQTVFPPAGPAVIIQLTSALPDINCDLTITGPGANVLTIQGQGNGNPFRFTKVLAGKTVSMFGLTLTNFYSQGTNGDNGVGGTPPTNGSQGFAGVIYNSGTLNLTECILSGNTVSGGAGGAGARDQGQNGGVGADGFGGAIYSDGTSLTIVRCAFYNNKAYGGAGGGGSDKDLGSIGSGNAAGNAWGGAIYIGTAGTYTITNSTFTGNIAYGGFGGTSGSDSNGNQLNGGVGGNAEGGAIYTTQPLTMTSCTIAQGAANAGNGGYQNHFNSNAAAGTAKGGGLKATGTITIGNCLVAANTSLDPVTSNNSESDVYGTFTSLDFNLIGGLDGTATGFTGAADQKGSIGTPIDAKLDPLGAQDNGGKVSTLRLRKGSPAVDKGKDLGGSGVDARGFTRPVDLADGSYTNAVGGDGSDIGAFESQTLPNDAPTTFNQSFNGAQATAFNQQLTAFDNDNDTLTFSVVSGTMPAGLTLNSDGSITGTPTAAGQNIVVMFKVNDGQADSSSAKITFNITEAPSLVVNTDIDNSTQYDGLTSLREAVAAAIDAVTNNGSSDPVTFDATFFATKKTITLSSGLSGSRDLAIHGPAAGVTISSSSGSILGVGSNVFAVNADLTNLTFANANGTALKIEGFPGPVVTITNCTFRDNGGTDLLGGALYNDAGTVTLTNCTFANNKADRLFNPNLFGGGAIYHASGTMTILNCTIAYNQSIGSGGFGGGGICITGGTVSIGNTIVAFNSASVGRDINGTIDSQGYNIISNSGGVTVNGDTTGNQLDVNPGLDANLADNGGPTQTFALISGSPAIDAGKAMGGVTTDQRGFSRPYDYSNITNANGGDGSDIGAFELRPISINIVADQASKAEGTGIGTTAFTFTISRIGSTSGAVSVDYAVTGSSENPADAADFGGTLPSGTITILDTQSSATLTIDVDKDSLYESDEEFTVTISNPPANHVIGTATATSLITNDDSLGFSIAADQASKAEGTGAGTTAFTFTVSRTGSTTGAVTVDYAVTGSSGNPADAADFGGTLPVGTVTIPDTQASATLTINVSKDAIFESDEEFTVTIYNPFAGYSITTATATSIITNDDIRSFSIAADQASKAEGTGSGVTAFTFTISRAASTSGAVTVDYAVTGSSGNPADAADFGGTLPSGTVTIQDTQASATLTINVSQDATVEPDEEFTVTLSNPNAGYVITTASATSIITNDDANIAGTVQITSGPTATPNPAAVGQTVTFTVAASDTNNGALNYTWDIAGTAVTGVAPQMAFNAPGTYTASVTVDNGAGGTATGSVQVTVVAPALGLGADTDGDGFSDEFEIAAGTSPSNAADSPNGGVAPTTAALTLSKVSVKLNFAKPASDSISFSGTLPVPANYSAASKTITVDFGGVVKAITLDEKGKSKSLSLGIKSTKGVVTAQTSKFAVKLLKGDFDAALQDEGLVNDDLKAASATVTVRVIFAGVIYENAQPLSYSAKKDKTGKAIPPKN